MVAQRPHEIIIDMKDTKTGVHSTEAKFILMFISLHSNYLDTGRYMYIPVSLVHSQSTPKLELNLPGSGIIPKAYKPLDYSQGILGTYKCL